MQASTSSLRSKLWSSGYKLSSNNVDEFLQYLVDNNMISSEESEDEHDNISIKHCYQGDNLDHLVTIMEQEVQGLEAQVLEFTGSSWTENDLNLLESESINVQESTDDEPSPVAEGTSISRSNSRRHHWQKSDPVQMFHRMQAIWSKHNTNRHCP